MNTLTFEEYLPLAIRTLPPFHYEKQMRHCRVGFITECGEALDCLKKHFYYNQPLNTDNLAEEIGDALWYIAGIMHTNGTPKETIMALSIAIQEFVPTVEVKGDELEDDELALELINEALTSNSVSDSLASLCFVAHFYAGKTIEEILYANIEKLKKRYPNGYSDFNAQARLDKTDV